MTATTTRSTGSGLTDAQRHAIDTDAAPLCIIAGAGTGKTRVLTERIARRILDAEALAHNTLAVTFTRKAAGEMSKRLETLGVSEGITCGTFHSVAYRMLREFWSLRDERPLSVLGSKTRLVNKALSGMRVRNDPTLARSVAREIEWAKAGLIGPDEYPDAARGRGDAPPAGLVRDAFVHYESLKQRRGVLDFEDLLTRLQTTLQTDRAFAHVVAGRIRHVYVDEFQDVTPAQFALLRAFTDSLDPTDLCVVGDDKQAIFAFNGASGDFLGNFCDTWPNAKVVRLDDNFRCSEPILGAANSVLGTGNSRSARPPGSYDDRPRIVVHATAEDEISWCVRQIRRAREPGRPWSRYAVLTRTNAQVEAITDAFDAARIPVRAASGAALMRRPEVRAVLSKMRDSEPAPGQPFAYYVSDLCDMHKKNLRDGSEPSDTALGVLIDVATEWEATGAADTRADIPAFLSFLGTAVSRDSVAPGTADGVHILTIHRAKGLEFDTVIVAGLEEGLLPIRQARSASAIDEERRLLYVAMTRAERSLWLSWARSRPGGRGNEDRRRSRFLDPVIEYSDAYDAANEPVASHAPWIQEARAILDSNRPRPDTSADTDESEQPPELNRGHADGHDYDS